MQNSLRLHVRVGCVTVCGASVAAPFVRFLVELVVRVRLAMKIHGAIAGDRGKPAWKARNVAQRDETGKCLKEYILDQVFRRRTWHAREENAVNHPGIARVKRPERRAVASLRGAHKRLVSRKTVGGGVHGNPTREWTA